MDFLELLCSLLEATELLEAIFRAIVRLVRWIFVSQKERRRTVYFQTGKSLPKPAERGVIFSPTRRHNGKRRRASYGAG
jgi:hypothetical protein